MNAQNAKEHLPLVQAMADGKVIEYQDSNGAWSAVDQTYFSQPIHRYRIKPTEPQRGWIGRAAIFTSLAEAVECVSLDELIEVVEVLK